MGYYHKRTGGTTYLLAYTKSGSAKLTYNHHEYTIIPNSLTFINLGEDSIIEAINNDWEIYFIHIFGAEVEDIYHYFNAKTNYILPNFNSNLFVNNIHKIYELMEQEKPEFDISTLIYQFLIEILNQCNTKPSESQINKIIEYMHENYISAISIDEIAKKFFISKYFFIRKFHKEVGITPKQYIAQLRLEKACSLLVHTKKSIAEIATLSGFVTEKNLIYAFSTMINTTPTRFRNEVYIELVKKQ